MPLTDKAIRALNPADKLFRKSDSKGLYIEVSPSGSKLWRWKYRFAGKEKRMALGAYPEVSLAEARTSRDLFRQTLRGGVDPSIERKRKKASAKLGSANTFAAVAEEYISKMEKDGRAESTLRKARWFLDLLRASIGSLPVDEVDPLLFLEALRRIENRGIYETAKKTRSFASRVFRYAVQTGRAKSDPASVLRGALISPKPKHYAAILDEAELGKFLRAVENYRGQPVTKLALRILPHVFLRPGELRLAKWDEIDFEDRVWKVPAERTKLRREHAVPLSRQTLSLLSELRTLSGPTGYMFPAFHTRRRPLSENTLNQAMRRMGYSKSQVTAHGFRATASTLLNESGLWNPDAIERALSHKEGNAVRAAYHRGLHWKERVEMAQWWSDKLYELREI